MEFVDVWSYVTIVVTLLMFLTGLAPCWKMYQTRSTQNVPFPIFLLSAISCLGMFHYGLMLGNGVLIFLNGVGATLQSIYVTLYISVVMPKTKSLLFLLAAVAYDALLYAYMYTSVNVAGRADILGSCSSLLTTFIMVLPAFEVVNNIRNKNADGMPLVMLLGGLACSSCWLLYGWMLKDPNIYAPNVPGIAITLTKLYMIWLYSDRKAKHD
jgi:solute carrier family 50 protein (sugar transporter)